MSASAFLQTAIRSAVGLFTPRHAFLRLPPRRSRMRKRAQPAPATSGRRSAQRRSWSAGHCPECARGR
eukprot:1195272-Alexandrium_andersonii.AAC.1